MKESADDFAERARKIAEQLEPGVDQVAKAATALARLHADYTGSAQNAPWCDFITEHFGHWSPRYIRMLIGIGNAEDPAAALREYRERNKERAQKIRERAKERQEAPPKPEVRTSPLEPAPEAGEGPQGVDEGEEWETVWSFYTELSGGQRRKFDARWQEEHTPRLVAQA